MLLKLPYLLCNGHVLYYHISFLDPNYRSQNTRKELLSHCSSFHGKSFLVKTEIRHHLVSPQCLSGLEYCPSYSCSEDAKHFKTKTPRPNKTKCIIPHWQEFSSSIQIMTLMNQLVFFISCNTYIFCFLNSTNSSLDYRIQKNKPVVAKLKWIVQY